MTSKNVSCYRINIVYKCKVFRILIVNCVFEISEVYMRIQCVCACFCIFNRKRKISTSELKKCVILLKALHIEFSANLPHTQQKSILNPSKHLPVPQSTGRTGHLTKAGMKQHSDARAMQAKKWNW